LQNKKAWGKPKTFRYWDVPAYARAHDLEPHTLMKRLREMEKIAKRIFSDSIPPSRKNRAPLTEREIREIKKAYLDGTDAKKIAGQFNITAARVGQLCTEEKAIRAAKREAVQNEDQPSANHQPKADDLEYPFSS
jgi:hypothetical protein